VSEITNRHYPGPRLERESWPSFQKEVFDAYRRHVLPLVGDGVTPPVEVVRCSTGTSLG
jgi:hypothetical protein